MSLNIKYRPTNLDDIVGELNQNTVSVLKTKIKDKDRPHSYLFVGQKGCGKTTVARILSKSFGSSDSDIKEYNGSSERGIDDIRGIIENLPYKPISDVKAIIIDECHALTKDAQNALLKSLEEPPSHVYFFLCTTDPQKLLATVKSRCSIYKLEPLPIQELRRFLTTISLRENRSFSKTVLTEIASKSEGSPRNALVILEKILDIEDEVKQLEIIELSSIDNQKTVLELCQAIAKNESWKSVSMLIKNVEGEVEECRRAILGYLTSSLLNSGDIKFFKKADCFRENFFDEGKSGLILACYEAINIK